MEQWCIGNYNSYAKGYNSTLGGNGSVGYSPSKETRQKLSKAHKGKKLSEETRKKLSKINKGKKLSVNHKNKLSGENSIHAKLDLKTQLKRLEQSTLQIDILTKN